MTIDYDLLNEIVQEYISNSDISKLSWVDKMCYEILSMKEPEIKDKEFSKTISLNESVNLVYDFLSTVSSTLASQFLNEMHSIKEDGTPYVTLSMNEKTKSVVKQDGTAIVRFNNTPKDALTLLHEIMHKLNSCWLEIEEEDNTFTTETNSRGLFSETVSIGFELYLLDYLLEKNKITQNDYNIILKERIQDTKLSAYKFIIQEEFIKLVSSGKRISKESIEEQMKQYDSKSFASMLFMNEYQNLRVTNMMLQNKKININLLQRYIIGLRLVTEIRKQENGLEELLNLHNLIGEAYVQSDKLIDELNNQYHVL